MKILLYLLFTLWQPHLTQSFATYLLSRSNCWTDLSTEEIIMNYRVVRHEESDDPQMHVKLVSGENPFPAGTIYPTQVSLQVVTENSATNRDYQFVMQVNGTGAAFVGGSCEGNRRIAGRAKEMVELTLQEAVPVTVWAGWAAGHEPVRLTPELVLWPSQPPDEHLDDSQQETPSWHEQLFQSCSSVDWASLTTTTTLAGRTIEYAPSAELYTEGTVEAPRVALRNVHDDFETLVIHCTAGAHVGTAFCPHMAVVSASDEWPVLQWNEERTLYISGLYSLPGNPTTLYRTKVLELEWTALEEMEENEKGIQAPAVTKDPRIRDDKETPGLLQENEKIVIQGHAKQIERDREAVKKKRGDGWKASTTTKEKRKPQATPDQPFDHVMVEDNSQEIIFDVGPHYYVGMAFMIGVGLLVTQFCLCPSRKQKGRRDL